MATSEQLYVWLIACHLVECVEWQTSKASQGNVGRHASQRNMKVFPKGECAGSATQKFLEFEFEVNEWMKGALKNYAGQGQEDAQEEEEPAPGSASADTTFGAPGEAITRLLDEEEPARPGELIQSLLGDEVKKETRVLWHARCTRAPSDSKAARC